jgi:hypothetical protein
LHLPLVHLSLLCTYAFYCGEALLKSCEHGLQTPNEAFFHQNPKLMGFGRQFGQMNFSAFGVFLADSSAPILVL